MTMTGVVGHRQVTDAYLAGLARHRSAQLATFDQGLVALHPDVTVLLAPPTASSGPDCGRRHPEESGSQN